MNQSCNKGSADLPDHASQLRDFVLQVGDAIAKLVSLQADLLRALNQSDGVQAALLGFFSQPVPAHLGQAVEPWQDWSPRVKVGFEQGADVRITVEPKVDHSLSPNPASTA